MACKKNKFSLSLQFSIIIAHSLYDKNVCYKLQISSLTKQALSGVGKQNKATTNQN